MSTSHNRSFLHWFVEELESKKSERHGRIEESTTWSSRRRGLNEEGLGFASRAVHERNQELEQRLAKLERAVAEGKISEPSRPCGLSSASVDIQRHNEELENQLARLEKLNMKEYKSYREVLVPTRWNEGSVCSVVGHQPIVVDKSRVDERIRILELQRMLRQAQELDLAFLVDATGSMACSIDEVKNLAPKIATGVQKAFPKLKLRVAFVPYRDYAEHDQDDAEKCDFTDSFEGPASTFVTSVSKVKATGGADTAEDVFSGLERVATLRWSSKTRVLIHIGDFPCHGKEFHDRVEYTITSC